jgi:hypothetical protein
VIEMSGRGGQALVSRATGMSRNTLSSGAQEVADGATRWQRVRRPGAGRKKAVDLDPKMLVVLDSLVEPESRGDLFGGAFIYDAWELYAAGVLTNPNMVVFGQIGRGRDG